MNPSPITKAFETIRTGLRGVIAGYGAGAEQPVHELGPEHLHAFDQRLGDTQEKPSIIWVPIGGPGKLQGNLRSETSIKNPAGITKPRQLMSLENRMDVYFWGHTLDEAWWLFSHWVHVARTALTAFSYNEPLSVRWSQTEDKLRGTYLIHTFHLGIPVTFEAVPYARAPLTPVVTGQFVTADQITTPQGEELPS
jgi:hypothetical protein